MIVIFYSVPGDKSALNPSGIRLGTPALTTRGFKEADMDRVADFIKQGKSNGFSLRLRVMTLSTA